MAYSEYDILTRTDRGAPAGELLRRYWQPAALADEVPMGGAPLPVRLLGEDLVLFRDECGDLGLLGIHCAHRGADLSYGRLEDGGLRCIYHGWLYDIHGNCLEQPGERLGAAAVERTNQPTGERLSPALGPAEPAVSAFRERIRHTAYPCVERAGVVFTYMGPGEPPLFPNYEFLTVPDEQVASSKLFHDCNYLQGNEGNIDLLHLSFLHHSRRADVGGSQGPFDRIHSRGAAPNQEKVEAEPTDYGLKVCKIRQMGEQQHLYHCTYIFPCAFAFSSHTRNEGYSVNWHVPIDDTHHWKFWWSFSRERTIDREDFRRGRLEMTADFKPTRNRANRYLQDRASMQAESYTGIGAVFQAQDMCVTEGAGPIQDRSQEHLTANDAPMVMARKLLLKGIKDIEDGKDPPSVIRDPRRNQFPKAFAYDTLAPADVDWRVYIRQVEADVESRAARSPLPAGRGVA